MSVYVAFIRTRGVGSLDAPAISDVRKRGTLTLGATDTTNSTEEGEIVLVVNGETSAIFAAFGTDPDGTLTTSTGMSSAGVPVPAGGSIALNPPKGSKVNVRAAS